MRDELNRPTLQWLADFLTYEIRNPSDFGLNFHDSKNLVTNESLAKTREKSQTRLRAILNWPDKTNPKSEHKILATKHLRGKSDIEAFFSKMDAVNEKQLENIARGMRANQTACSMLTGIMAAAIAQVNLASGLGCLLSIPIVAWRAGHTNADLKKSYLELKKIVSRKMENKVKWAHFGTSSVVQADEAIHGMIGFIRSGSTHSGMKFHELAPHSTDVLVTEHPFERNKIPYVTSNTPYNWVGVDFIWRGNAAHPDDDELVVFYRKYSDIPKNQKAAVEKSEKLSITHALSEPDVP